MQNVIQSKRVKDSLADTEATATTPLANCTAIRTRRFLWSQ